MQRLLRPSAASHGVLLPLLPESRGPLGGPLLCRAPWRPPYPREGGAHPGMGLSYFPGGECASCEYDREEYRTRLVIARRGAPLYPVEVYWGPPRPSYGPLASIVRLNGPSPPSWVHATSSSSRSSSKGGQRRCFSVGGSYGYGAFYRGDADVHARSNIRLQRLDGEGPPKKWGPMVIKMPETLATLVAEGALRRPLSRPGVSVYHHCNPSNPNNSFVYLHATTQEQGAPAAAAATSLLQQRERGFAAQLILDGRGVKAYFEPEWPDLMVRLGVGVKPLALRRLAEQYATKARIFVDKRGLLLTIHGYDKRAVGTLTMELYRHLKANPYTAKGARIAFYPIKKKIPTKR